MRRKKWVVAKTNKDLAASTAQELSIDPLAALLVTSRGFDDINSIDEFFDPDAPLSLDPFSIKDMDLAAERINRAIDDFELICVFGDYDADGVTATALLYSYLEARGANVIRYVPDRLTEGYGLNIAAVDQLAESGVKLIVRSITAFLPLRRPPEQRSSAFRSSLPTTTRSAMSCPRLMPSLILTAPTARAASKKWRASAWRSSSFAPLRVRRRICCLRSTAILSLSALSAMS